MEKRGLLPLGGLVFVAVSLVVIGDTAGKLMTSAGVSPFLVAWLRFAIAAVVLAPFSGLKLSEFKHIADPRVLLRAGFIIGGITCILTALRTEPIANVFGAFFIGPIVAYILAIVVLGERPNQQRSIALVIGFLGVLLVVKPGFGFSPGLGFALMAGICYGAYLTATKALAGYLRPRLLLFSQLAIGAIVLLPFGLSVEMPQFTGKLASLLAISALGSAAGNYLLVIANRHGEASLIAPLVYSQLISATALGLAVFGDWPDMATLAGLVLIAGSGFSALWTARPAP